MKTIQEATKLIENYQDSYRHPKMKRFTISGLYDLFPEKDRKLDVESQWPSQWPNCGKSGVYLFLDERGIVIYIGKANHLGNRLANYCSYGESKKCKLNHSTWKSEPRYIVTVGIDQETWFENSSLESYLIENISTSDNILGNY